MRTVEGEHRHLSRDSLFVLATLRLDGEASDRRVRIRNLSPGGVMGEGRCRVTPGQAVIIEIRNAGWVKGRVVWVQDDRFGIAFDEDIDARIVRAAPSVPDEAPMIRRPQAMRGHPNPKALRNV
ncbi:MAG: PilZ domain-containing protein [Sphingomonadales bacterium]|nr:PilZ domain-containing protein [Sphingomonadales bacterium]